MGAEQVHGYEQVFGLRFRDLAHYRPLIEFCFTIPDDQFVRSGVDRWLARRMARGLLPEAQRTERRYGMHNVDWHARLTPRLPELRACVERMAGQPAVARHIDLARARQLLDTWPEEDPGVSCAADQWRFTLPATVYMARFVDFVTGRN
jgi:asparagine synthase (glutamine-hydrolysing)